MVKSTLIFYEAPHRVAKTLSELEKYFGDRSISICRELTKLHETVIRMKISEAKEYYEQNAPKGEFVLVVEGYTQTAEEDLDFVHEYSKYIEAGVDRKEALKLISKRAGVPKRDVYNIINNNE